VKGECAAKVQEYECTRKAASEEFASKEKQMTAEVKVLQGQLSQSQNERDAAVKAGSALSQQLECVNGECAAKVQEYETKIQTANNKCKSTTLPAASTAASNTLFRRHSRTKRSYGRQVAVSNSASGGEYWPACCGIN
jgi:hypothetical protein